MTAPRCGRCSACLTVAATQQIVVAEQRPCGPGINDASVRMWNKVLKDNPCNGDPSTGDRIRANAEILRKCRRRYPNLPHLASSLARREMRAKKHGEKEEGTAPE